MRLNLEFAPEKLGAKSRDKIGVQLLYCPTGWSRIGIKSVQMLLEDGSDKFPILSNKIEFTAP